MRCARAGAHKVRDCSKRRSLPLQSGEEGLRFQELLRDSDAKEAGLRDHRVCTPAHLRRPGVALATTTPALGRKPSVGKVCLGSFVFMRLASTEW